MVSLINKNSQPSAISSEPLNLKSETSLAESIVSIKHVDLSTTSNPKVDTSDVKTFSLFVFGTGSGVDNHAKKELSRHQQRVKNDETNRAAIFGPKKKEDNGPFSRTKALAQQSEDFRNKRASKAAAARKAEQTSQKMTSTDKPRGIEGAIKSLDKNGKKLNDFIGVLSMFK